MNYGVKKSNVPPGGWLKPHARSIEPPLENMARYGLREDVGTVVSNVLPGIFVAICRECKGVAVDTVETGQRKIRIHSNAAKA